MPAKKVAKKTAKDTAAGKTAASAPNQTAVKQQSDAAAKAPSKQLQNQPPDGEPQCEGAQQTDGEPTENGEEQNGARTHVVQGYHPGHENLDTHVRLGPSRARRRWRAGSASWRWMWLCSLQNCTRKRFMLVRAEWCQPQRLWETQMGIVDWLHVLPAS